MRLPARRKLKGLGLALLLALLLAGLVLVVAPRVWANSLVADLSKHLIAITTGFAGTDVLLFGATEKAGDVIVVVRGPETPVTLHRKARIAGIWMNTASQTFETVPGYFWVAASRPLEDIANQAILARHQMGLEHLRLDLPRARVSPNAALEWRAGLIRNMQTDGLYLTNPGRVVFLGNQLFRTDIHLPANVPTGTYLVHAYLLKNGHLVSAQTTPLLVSKIGVQAWIFDFAHQQSAWYGVVAIVIALLAGWLAHMAFRKG
jgi:uncharacterized protein (TIGR02186 family)